MTGAPTPHEPEVLDAAGPESRARRSRVLVVAGVVALAVGTLLGLRLGGASTPAEQASVDSGLRLVAGAVQPLRHEYGFQVWLHNTGGAAVEVTGLYAGGPGTGGEPGDRPEDSARPTTIPPDEWRAVRLRTSAACGQPDTDVVHASARPVGSRDPGELVLPLPASSPVPEEFLASRCTRLATPQPAALTGVWVVAHDRAYGSDRPTLWRFEDDGTFAMDSNRRLFQAEPDTRGTYELNGADLSLRVTGASRTACVTGQQIDIRVGQLSEERLLLRFARFEPTNRDGCVVPTGVEWVLERLVAPPGDGSAQDRREGEGADSTVVR
jgi:hypothetical protein